MSTDRMWQNRAIDSISTLLREEDSVKAVLLTGSLADDPKEADEWSDVDLKVILSDAAVERFFQSTAWLARLGDVIAEDRTENDYAKTLRVCLTDFRRFDITFIPESSLAWVASWDYNPFPDNHVVWSRIPNLYEIIARIPAAPTFEDTSSVQLSPIAEGFWFKVAIAIAKVVRNDLLVGLHLALDLVRDCLLLQMMLRDREVGTNIHRRGGFGNELLAELHVPATDYSAEGILNMVCTAGQVFDKLAIRLNPDYRRRWELLQPAVVRAKATL